MQHLLDARVRFEDGCDTEVQFRSHPCVRALFDHHPGKGLPGRLLHFGAYPFENLSGDGLCLVLDCAAQLRCRLGHAPGTGDTAIINTSTATIITIQSGDIQIQSITTGSNDTLSIAGGSLRVTSGNSTLSGALSMSGNSQLTATDAAGNQSTVWFNDLGAPSRVENALGAISTYAYDPNGNLVRHTDAAGNTDKYSYDSTRPSRSRR